MENFVQTLTTVDARTLVPHPRNGEFFDDLPAEKWTEFKESIRTSGILSPITITKENVIISGHQRVKALFEIAKESKEPIPESYFIIPCVVQSFSSPDMELKALIETNIRQRGVLVQSAIKTARIVHELERIYGIGKQRYDAELVAARAECEKLKKQLADARTLEKLNPQDPSTQKELAQMLGMSERQYYNCKKLNAIIPELQNLLDNNDTSVNLLKKIVTLLSPADQLNLSKALADIPSFQERTRFLAEQLSQQQIAAHNRVHENQLEKTRADLAAAEANNREMETRFKQNQRYARELADRNTALQKQLDEVPAKYAAIESQQKTMAETITTIRSENETMKRVLSADNEERMLVASVRSSVHVLSEAINQLNSMPQLTIPAINEIRSLVSNIPVLR